MSAKLIGVYTAALACFHTAFMFLGLERKETPEDALFRGYKAAYPKWEREGLIKKPR